jgi:metallo-beta-lactamase family protein
MSIEIQFLGAVGCVTGSQFLVTAGDSRVIVDCGMFQGSPEEVSRNRLPFSFEPDTVEALLLTHAHLDHVGRVPALVKQGYRGPIIATHGTVELGEIVMRDAAKLQAEAEARWRRRHPEAAEGAEEEAAMETDDPSLPERIRHARPEGRTDTRAALYAEADVDQAMRQARGVDYDAEVPVLEGITAVFHDAGHILGSAIIELRVTDGGATTTIVFSGDLGRDGTPILRDPAPLAHADYVLVESTYGNREHAPHEQAVDELVAALGDVAMSTGVMLIPAFAIGRTQELIWILDELVRQGRIPRLPLYLDSPMASRATVVYRNHPEAYDDETRRLLESGDSPLEYPGQEFTDSVEQSKAIRTAARPFMIVASSGMLTGGRIMHHLKDFLPDPASTLLFIGYQGEGTLGRHLADGARTARIDGKEIEVKCRVRSISGFSAHADQHELIAWVRRFAEARSRTDGGTPQTVFVVHGDPDAAEAFATTIRGELDLSVHVPTHQERVTLRA